MTVAGLLGPDKRHIKASSDIHLIFYIVLSDFFYIENAVPLTPITWHPHHGSITTIAA